MSASLPQPIEQSGVRIGVFGGAFDPPHNAHLALARAALDQFALAVLYIIPTGQAWHRAGALSAPEHRLAMTRLAFEGMPGARVDDRELRRAGPSYTIDTLQALQAENPGAQLHLFLGADQFEAFRQWHRWQEILGLAIICIADRAQFTRAETRFDAYAGHNGRFRLLKLPLMPVSATRIRELVAAGGAAAGEIAQWLPEPVARYISAHQLYRSH